MKVIIVRIKAPIFENQLGPGILYTLLHHLIVSTRWTQLELDELSQSAVRDAIQHPPAIDQKLSEQKTGKCYSMGTTTVIIQEMANLLF